MALSLSLVALCARISGPAVELLAVLLLLDHTGHRGVAAGHGRSATQRIPFLGNRMDVDRFSDSAGWTRTLVIFI